MLANKNVIIGIVIFVVIIIIAAGGFLLLSKSNLHSQQAQTQSQDTPVLQKLSSDDLGLTLSASDDKKKIKFSITKLADIREIEYEITYDANASSQELAQGSDTRVSRGITGDVKVNGGQSSYDSPMLDLGSCSRNVCHYDTGVTTVKMTLKLTKGSGKIYQAEQSLTL